MKKTVLREYARLIVRTGLNVQKGQDVLIMATGAMMSPDSVKQGQPIPAVAHLIRLQAPKGEG